MAIHCCNRFVGKTFMRHSHSHETFAFAADICNRRDSRIRSSHSHSNSYPSYKLNWTGQYNFESSLENKRIIIIVREERVTLNITPSSFLVPLTPNANQDHASDLDLNRRHELNTNTTWLP